MINREPLPSIKEPCYRNPMKRFFVFVALAGSAAAGFMWWKRREVSRAGAIAEDPWPSVVTETKTITPPIEVETSPKKSTAKKSTAKNTKKAPTKVEPEISS